MSQPPTDDRIPVTVVSGPLGAGKTTLVNHVLRGDHGYRVAVVVNDLGEVNVDAERIADERGGEDGIVDLSNGCICCELQGDLLDAATRVADARTFDYLLVEASGVSAPMPIARAFTVGVDGSDIDPTERFRLDTTVSVIDAYGFWKEFDPDVSPPPGAGDAPRPLADVLVDHVEFCDVLLLNKCDMVPDDALDEVEATIRELQPEAAFFRTAHADVDPEYVLGTGRFDFERASRAAGWKRRLSDAGDGGTEGETVDGDHAAEAHDGRDAHEAVHEHGLSAVVYETRRPFHPARLAEWLDGWDGRIVRAKGVFNLAGRDEVMGLSWAGPSVQAGPIGEWDNDEVRRTQLVFIGDELDADSFTLDLDGCLVTNAEHGAGTFDDPFPLTFVR